MQTMIMQNGHRLAVFNEENVRRLATANEAIRHIRNRAILPAVSAVYIDDPRPVVLLQSEPDSFLICKATGLHSKKVGDDRYLVRGTAFGVDWQWFAPTVTVAMRRAA